MYFPKAQTDIRKPAANHFAIPKMPDEVLVEVAKPEAPRKPSKPAVKPLVKSVYLREPTAEEVAAAELNDAISRLGSNDAGVKEFVAKYMSKK